MFFCYIDESGGFEAPNQSRTATPLMVIAGLIVPSAAIGPLTEDLLALKRQFYPNRADKHLDYLLYEIKGLFTFWVGVRPAEPRNFDPRLLLAYHSVLRAGLNQSPGDLSRCRRRGCPRPLLGRQCRRGERHRRVQWQIGGERADDLPDAGRHSLSAGAAERKTMPPDRGG